MRVAGFCWQQAMTDVTCWQASPLFHAAAFLALAAATQRKPVKAAHQVRQRQHLLGNQLPAVASHYLEIDTEAYVGCGHCKHTR